MIQRLKMMFNDERGVSSVIGVVLMVGITVVLAATAGTFVLDIGQELNKPAPTAMFDVTTNTHELEHNGETAAITEVELTFQMGQEIDTDNIQVYVESKRAYARGDKITKRGDDTYRISEPFADDDVISAGSSTKIWTKTNEHPDYWSDPGSSDPYFSANNGDVTMKTDGSKSNVQANDLGLESGDLVRITYESDDTNKIILFKYEVK
jgi:flagellin-like protein